MSVLNKVMQLLNSLDSMIDNMNLFHLSLVVDADLDALGISEALSTLETKI